MAETNYRARLVVPCSFATMSLMGVAVSLLGPSLAGIAARTGTNLTAAAVLFTLFGGGSLLATFGLARLVDTPARRVLLAGGSLALAAGFWLFAGSDRLVWAGITIAAAGFAMSASGITPNVLIAELYGSAAPAALNALHMAAGIGSFCGPLAVGLAIQHGSDYTVVFRGLAILEAFVGLAWLVARPPDPHQRQDAGLAAPSLGPLGPIFLLAVLMLLYVGSEQTVGGWTFAYARQVATSSAAMAGAATSLFWLALIGGRLVASRLLRRMTCAPLLLFCVLLGGMGIALVSLAPTWPFLLWAGLALSGLAFGPIFPTTMALAVQSAPTRMGVISSLLVAAGAGGSMTLPWLAGRLIPVAGLRGAVTAVEVPLALMLLCLWLLASDGGRPRPADLSPENRS